MTHHNEKALIIIAEGCEESETVIPIDVLYLVLTPGDEQESK
jgi:hypothetical protein